MPCAAPNATSAAQFALIRARTLHSKGGGEVKLQMPKLRRQAFETAIIERYKRREASIKEALMEMYLAGVSERRVEDITDAMCGIRFSSGTFSKLNKKVYQHIETGRDRPIKGELAFVYLNGIVLKHSWTSEAKNVSVLVAIGVDQDSYRSILDVHEGHEEDNTGWGGFLAHLKQRGLKGVQLIISDACPGLVESIADYYSDADWQRCAVPCTSSAMSSAMYRAIKCGRWPRCSRPFMPRRIGLRRKKGPSKSWQSFAKWRWPKPPT